MSHYRCTKTGRWEARWYLKQLRLNLGKPMGRGRLLRQLRELLKAQGEAPVFSWERGQ